MEFLVDKIAGNANVIKFFRRFFRFVVPLAAICFLVYSLMNLPDGIFITWQKNIQWTPLSYIFGFLLVLLSFINWALEALKWKLLAGKLQKTDFVQAFRGVLYGVTLGMITPKRSGEFLGRTMILFPQNRVGGMVINMAGSLSQLTVTIIAGFIALGFAMSYSLESPGILVFSSSYAPWLGIGISSIVLGAGVLGVPSARRRIPRRWLNLKWIKPLGVLRQLTQGEILNLMAWSVLRYLVFIIQFYILLKLFSVPVDLATSFLLLAITYLFLSPIPVTAIVEAGVRGSVILMVYELFFLKNITASGLEISLVGAMLGLWFVNLALPAISGALLGISGKAFHQKSM